MDQIQQNMFIICGCKDILAGHTTKMLVRKQERSMRVIKSSVPILEIHMGSPTLELHIGYLGHATQICVDMDHRHGAEEERLITF